MFLSLGLLFIYLSHLIMHKRFAYMLVFLLFVSNVDAVAQCAMCRTTIESSISSGRTNIATGLNTGILYLLSAPYLLVAAIAYLWFVQSKKEQKEKIFQLKIKSKVAEIFGSKA